jgi:hypothetical protein
MKLEYSLSEYYTVTQVLRLYFVMENNQLIIMVHYQKLRRISTKGVINSLTAVK